MGTIRTCSPFRTPDLLHPADRSIGQPDFNPMGMEGGAGQDLTDGPLRKSPASLVFLLDDPDLHSWPDMVP